jgi:hypothetical protein
MGYDNEPTTASPLTVETLTDDGWRSFPAWIADLTRQELWVTLDQRLAGPLDPGRSVRLMITHPTGPTQVAETVVLWHIGRTGKLVVLKRPRLWDPPSRRAHARARLAVPVYLTAEEGSEPVPATSIDVGVGGLFCVVAMDLRIGQRVDAAVQLTPNHEFECQAEVARLDEDPNDPMGIQLKVGLQFLDLTDQDQAYLARTIARLARDVDADFVPRPWRHEEEPVEPQSIGEASAQAADAEGRNADPAAESGAVDDVLISIELDEQTA